MKERGSRRRNSNSQCLRGGPNGTPTRMIAPADCPISRVKCGGCWARGADVPRGYPVKLRAGLRFLSRSLRVCVAIAHSPASILKGSEGDTISV